MRFAKHLRLGAKLLPSEHATMAVVAALFSVVMATVGVQTATMRIDWYGRCKDEGDDPEQG